MAQHTVTLTDLEEAALADRATASTTTPDALLQALVTQGVDAFVPGYQQSIQKATASALAAAPLDAQLIALKLVTAPPDVQSKAIDALKVILA